MRRFNIAALAIGTAAVGLLVFLAVSFLPLFMREAWGPLWGAEWQYTSSPRSFGHVGPLCGVSLWPYVLVVPVSSLLVLVLFALVVAVFVLPRRRA